MGDAMMRGTTPGEVLHGAEAPREDSAPLRESRATASPSREDWGRGKTGKRVAWNPTPGLRPPARIYGKPGQVVQNSQQSWAVPEPSIDWQS